MKTITSVSGGQSSAYIAAHYPADFLVFALVCIEDPRCAPKDRKLVQKVSDKLGQEFVATAEDDIILHTMFDKHPEKMEWFSAQERIEGKGQWIHGGTRYDDIAKHRLQHELTFEDFSECDSGHCGL